MTVTGETVYAHHPDTQLAMASLTKLYVSAAGLTALGPDFHFQTRVHALGPVQGGSVPGIGIIGGGSPCLDEHHTDKQPDLIFVNWANQLKQAGITRIDGDVVIDNRLFSGPDKPATYPQDHLNQQKWYSAPASAFAWNDNCIEARALPTAIGQPAQVEVRPRSNRIAITNSCTTDAKGRVYFSRAEGSNGVRVSGKCAKETAWNPMAIHTDADLLAGDHCAAVLSDHGIAITGHVRLGAVPPTGALLIDQRDPLLPAINILNSRSQNFYGEQLIRVLASERGQPGSIEAGSATVREVLGTELGLNLDHWTIVDGSGLSYENSASARSVAELLAAMAASPHGLDYRHSLKEKWSGKTRGWVKTGSLSISRCLAGFVEGPGDRDYVFAILLNRADAKSIGWASGIRDRLFTTIAGLAAGS